MSKVVGSITGIVVGSITRDVYEGVSRGRIELRIL